MRKGTIAAVFLVAMLGASNAEAAKFEFRGDRGTACVVEVGADASKSLQFLQTPRVGFSANPVCTYAARSEDATAGDAKAKTGTCKKKKAKSRPKAGAKKRGCKKKKKRGKHRAATFAAAAPQTATIQQAQLYLLGAGTALPGDQTLASLGVGGYTCSVLPAVSTCADQGNLTPATPEVPYQARYQFTVVPPPGEHWVTVPAGCTGAAAPACTLLSPSVVPMVL